MNVEIRLNQLFTQLQPQFDPISGQDLIEDRRTEFTVSIPLEFVMPDFTVGAVIFSQAYKRNLPQAEDFKNLMFYLTALSLPKDLARRQSFDLLKPERFSPTCPRNARIALPKELPYSIRADLKQVLRDSLKEQHARIQQTNVAVGKCAEKLRSLFYGGSPHFYDEQKRDIQIVMSFLGQCIDQFSKYSGDYQKNYYPFKKARSGFPELFQRTRTSHPNYKSLCQQVSDGLYIGSPLAWEGHLPDATEALSAIGRL